MELTIQEVSRKLLHVIALVMPGCILYLPREAPVILGIIFMVMAAIEWVRFRYPPANGLFARWFSIMLRREEAHVVTGATWIILSAFILSVFFINHPRVAAVALTLFILGDSAAAIVGMTLGRIRTGRKTLEGSLACLAMCLILHYALFPHLPGLGGRPMHPLTIWVSSLAVTIFELVPLSVKGYKINDNLSAPIIAAVVIFLLEHAV